MKLAALHHITVPGKGTYTPGEIILDDLSDGQIRRLLRLGAVRVMENGAEDSGKASPPFEEEPDDTGDADGEDDEQPEPITIDAGESIVDVPAEKQKKIEQANSADARPTGKRGGKK